MEIPKPQLRSKIAYGFSLLQQAQMAAAEELATELLALADQDAEVLFFAAEVKLAAQDIEAALPLMLKACAAAPGQPQLLLKLARLQMAQRLRTDARRSIAAAVTAAGRDPKLLWEIGDAYARLDDPVQAQHYLDAALMAGCSDARLRFDLAKACFFRGEFEAAEQHLERMLAQMPKAGHALYLRATLRTQTADRNHVQDLRTRLESGMPDAAMQAAACYALAKELEDLGNADASFAALSEGAAAKRASFRYDAAVERSTLDGVRAAWGHAEMQKASTGHGEHGAIFIVGMPRTGTTLVERMLTQHQQVRSAGELLDFGHALSAAARRLIGQQAQLTPIAASLQIDFSKLGRDYMRGAREAAPESDYFVDKMPVNYMYCGLIRKALPNAKIIHLVREPMDSCYAVFKTHFGQAYHFSYDQDELAAYFATYQRLMRHWHEVMPGQILDVRYESLVDNIEHEARRILEFCGLQWQDAVLDPSGNQRPATTASAAQVRAPVHARSVGNWRKYEAGLAPLKARLIAEGIVKA